MISVSLKKINKFFVQSNNNLHILKDVNINLTRGKLMCLVGPSGSGKTTLLQITGLLDSADSGSITINSKVVNSKDDKIRTKFRRDYIGFIYQNSNLFPEFTAIENVAISLLIKGYSKSKSISLSEEIIEKIGLKSRKNHKPFELSGGQQQRIAIARAMVGNPHILLADEPTGNLDSDNAYRIFNLIKDFTKKFNVSTLLVTHNLELANKSDKIINIKDGVIYE